MNHRFIKYLYPFCFTILLSTNLNDVSYSIKQNGIMVNLDYDNPINDDDIIGWKSDRGWVYLTLLGVRAPKNKIPQQRFQGDVKKIVIDDFDESTQLAILIRKPVLGYDIINSKTSPSTIVFIHTEMKQSEVASLKEHIAQEGKSVFNVAQSSGFPKFNTNFRNAFNQAREQLGPNAIFEYHGKLYTTNHPGESGAKSKSILIDEINKENDLIAKNRLSKHSTNDVYVEKTTGEVFTELKDEPFIAENVITKDKKTITNNRILDNDSTMNMDKNLKIIKDEKRKNKTTGFRKLVSFFTKRKTIKNIETPINNKVKNDNQKKKNFAENITDDSVYKAQQQYRKLQQKHIPNNIQNVDLNQTDHEYYIASETQLSDTTYTQELQLKDTPPLHSDVYKDLQKKHIPLPSESMFSDTVESGFRSLSLPQFPDTNTVQAWFTDENMIPEEFNPSYLQKQHVPSDKNDFDYQRSQQLNLKQSEPQNPEYTAPFILDKRYKTQYKNNSRLQKQKKGIEVPFEPVEKETNTWLSFFPSQNDSIKESLKWEFKEENEVPIFLHRDKESLDYSSRDNFNYSWQKQLLDKRPKSFPPRYSDPGFRYYHEGGIKIESNMDGVPIYIDGKYIGDTPLVRPINVEPGWHQVSGFSPVYTHLASKKGLQYVGYDSIINNNELYGSTTVYAESGKIETVSLKFNQMGDTPKKWIETKGGMSLGLPMFSLLIGLITWAM